MGASMMRRLLSLTAAFSLAVAHPVSAAPDFLQQNPATFKGDDFERSGGVIKKKPAPQRFVTGLTDTLLTTDGTIHWTGRVIDNRTQTLPGCPSGIDTEQRDIVDDVGLATIYPITITPSSGTINGGSSYKINWAFGGVTLRCDGVGNYVVKTTTRTSPPAISLEERLIPDTNSFITVYPLGMGSVPQQVSLLNLLATADGGSLTSFDSTCSVTAPCLLPAEASNTFIFAGGGGDVYLNLQSTAFRRPYKFYTDGTTTIFLDPGKNGLFQGFGGAGKMLKIAPGEAAEVRRRNGGIFHVLAGAAPTASPGKLPYIPVTTVGDYDLPSDGGGNLYLTTAATNFTIQNTTQQIEYCVGNKSGGTATVEPGASQQILPQGQVGKKLLVPTGGIVCFYRWTAGLWVVTRWVGDNTYESTLNIGSAVNLAVSGTSYDITFIDLPPGRWNISGAVAVNPAAATTTTSFSGWASFTSVTAPGKPNFAAVFESPGTWTGVLNAQHTFGPWQVTTSTAPTTRVYLSARASFSGGTLGGYGYIRATQY